jgi:hypothetical protein
LGEAYLAHGGRGHWGFGGEIDYQQLLADALGIPVEDLEAAYEKARVAALEKAVAEGLITQEQADEMTVWGGGWRRGLPFFSFWRGGPSQPGGHADLIDEQALLAEALGISAGDLQLAREKANQAAIEMAVEEGHITQEQADAMAARRELQSYLDRDALLAQALGIGVEDLEGAYADGKTLSTLLDELELDAATVRDRLAEAHRAALDQAVEDGVITQEQRDGMARGRGMPFPGGPGRMPFPGDCEDWPAPRDRQGMPFRGDHEGMWGHRGFRGMRPPGSGIRFRRPRRLPDAENAL